MTGASPETLRRMARKVAIDKAAILVGGQRALARALDVGERVVRAWLGFDREIPFGVLRDTASALELHAAQCLEQAGAIRLMVADQGATMPASLAQLTVAAAKAALPADYASRPVDETIAAIRNTQQGNSDAQ